MTGELLVRRALSGESELLERAQGLIHPQGSPFELLQEVKHPLSSLWIAVKGQECVGYCLLRTAVDETEILHIEVAEPWRKKGIGRQLIQGALDEFANNVVFLEVRESNRAAIGLYEQHGFEVVGRREAYYGNPQEDALLMGKSIDGDQDTHV